MGIAPVVWSILGVNEDQYLSFMRGYRPCKATSEFPRGQFGVSISGGRVDVSECPLCSNFKPLVECLLRQQKPTCHMAWLVLGRWLNMVSRERLALFSSYNERDALLLSHITSIRTKILE